MNNEINKIDKIKLLLIFTLFVLGIFLIIKPKPNNISTFAENNVSVTVLNLKEKSEIDTNKIIGVILILSSILSYYITYRNPSNSNNNIIELTPQENKIYNLIKDGDSNKEIASKLHVSVSTIKTHINNIYKKMGISSRKELLNNPLKTED